MIYASNNGNLQIESTNFTGGRINLTESGSSVNGTNGANTSNTGSILTQNIHYHHTDHLGSVRAITNQNGEVIEQNAYYPFGCRHTFGNTYAQTTNRFKFNGKEEQTTGNLQYLDYGARMYDSNIGRWTTQDPLAEKYYAYSPYNYCGGNPVLRIDYEGKFWETAWDAASLTMGLKSLINNIREGNVGAAIADGVGVIIDAAAAITPFVPGGVSAAISAVRVVDKVDDIVDAGKGMKNAEAIAEGRAFGKETLQRAKDSGLDVAGEVRIVPQNGIGNKKGNRTTVDQLIRNEDDTYTIVETKLRSTTNLSPGQSKARKHVEIGSQKFEIRSKVDELNLHVGDAIIVTDYKRINKYE